MFVNTAEVLIKTCEEENKTVYQYTIEEEVKESSCTVKQIRDKMRLNLQVMKEACEKGLKQPIYSVSGLIGGDAYKLNSFKEQHKTFLGDFAVKAMGRAMSCSEVNASMGKIVAAPTAGSSGILPSVLITAAERYNFQDEDLINGLFTASGIGILIAKNATLAGAEGGCQAECGSAAAMAAGAVVEMLGGSPEMAFNAGSIVLKSVMGLVCDPIAGLVEVPCAKRNSTGAVLAMAAVDMVMCGVKSVIPFDDVVNAMYKVGKQLPSELRETAMGGIAVSPCGLRLKEKIQQQKRV